MPAQDFTIDFRVSGIEDLQRAAAALNTLRESFIPLSQQIKESGAGFREVSSSAREGKKGLLGFGGLSDKIRVNMKQLAVALFISGGAFTDMGRLMARASLATSAYQIALEHATPSVKTFFKAHAGRFLIGALATAMGIAALSLASFEEKLTRLRQVGGFATEKMGDLRKAVERLQEQLGIFTGDQIVDALTTVVKAGFTLEQALGGLAQTALKFSHVAQVDVKVAVEDLAKASKQTGLAWDTLANAITLSADISEVGIQQVAATLVRGGASIQAGVGLSVAGFLALTTQLTRMGLEGEAAGRAISRLAIEARKLQISRLTGPEQRLFESNAAARQALDLFRKGQLDLLEFIKRLHDAGFRLGEFTQIFDTFGARAAAAIGPAFDKIMEAQKTLASGSQVVEQRYNELVKGLSGRLKQLASDFDKFKRDVLEAFLPLGNILLDVLRSILTIIGNIIAILKGPFALIGQIFTIAFAPIRLILSHLSDMNRMLAATITIVVLLGVRLGWFTRIAVSVRAGLLAIARAGNIAKLSLFGLLNTLRAFMLRFLPLLLLFEGLGFLFEKLGIFGGAPVDTDKDSKKLQETIEKETNALLAQIAENTDRIPRKAVLFNTRAENVLGLDQMFKRLFGRTHKEERSLIEVQSVMPKEAPEHPLIGAQSGFLGHVKGATQFLAGEAGTELVAILRNPRALLTGPQQQHTGGGAFSGTVQNISSIGSAIFTGSIQGIQSIPQTTGVGGITGSIASGITNAVSGVSKLFSGDIAGAVGDIGGGLLKGVGGGGLQSILGNIPGIGGITNAVSGESKLFSGDIAGAVGDIGGGLLKGVGGGGLQSILGNIPGIGGITNAVSGVSKLFSGDIAGAVGDIGGGLLKGVGVPSPIADVAGNLGGKLLGGLGGLFGLGGKSQDSMLGGGGGPVPGGLPSPLGLLGAISPVGGVLGSLFGGGTGPSAGGGPVSVSITINLQGTGEAMRDAEIIGSELERRLRAFFQFSMGAEMSRREGREMKTPMRDRFSPEPTF
jgi:DNA-binding transcriptional MerR regulator